MINNHVYQFSVATEMPYDKQPQNLSGLKQYTFIFAYISLIRARLSRANLYVCNQLKSAGRWLGSFPDLALPFSHI